MPCPHPPLPPQLRALGIEFVIQKADIDEQAVGCRAGKMTPGELVTAV